MLFVVRDFETGNVIEECETLEKANETIADYERIDKEEGNYILDFYEVAVQLENGDTVSLENFEGYYVVELVEYYCDSEIYCNKINHSWITDAWNKFETFSKEEAEKEAKYQLSIAEKYQGVIIHHYTNKYNHRLEVFEENEFEMQQYYKSIEIEYLVDDRIYSSDVVDCNSDLDDLLEQFIVDFEKIEEIYHDSDKPKKKHTYRISID